PAHLAWSGSRLAWSMSGFDITRFAFRRMSGRSADGVSPSYTAARIWGSCSDRTWRTWSRARAFVGNRYSAVAFGSATARAAKARLYTSVFPDAVPVATTTFEPDETASYAARWCGYK